MSERYLQPDIHVIVTQLPGVDGMASPARMTQIEHDLGAMLSRPIINALGDVPDVSAASPDDGDVLVYDGEASEWVPGSSGGTIWQVRDQSGTLKNDVNQIWFRRGIEVEDLPGSNLILVQPTYGTSANSVARGNHPHNIYLDQPYQFSASGSLSGGARELVSGTYTGLDTDRTYIIKATLYVHLRGDGSGASYVLPSVRIWTNTQNHFEDARGVAGVTITETTQHPGVQISGVSAVAVSASIAYRDGDPAYIGGGVLIVSAEANR